MVAYVLQMLFLALSLFSVLVMVVMIIKDMRATKKQWWALFLPIVLLFMTIAFRFEWTENANNDFSRYLRDFAGLKREGFDYEMRYADEFSILWKVIVYAFTNVENLHWFPVFTVGVEFFVFFYILISVAEEDNLSATDVVLCLLLRLAMLPLVMSIAASRNTLAYTFFSVGIYIYRKRGLLDLRVYLWMLAGVLTHTTVILGFVIFVLSLLCIKYKAFIVVFPLLGYIYGAFIAPVMMTSSNEYLQYLAVRWDMYTSKGTRFDIVKTILMITGYSLLWIWALCWYFSKNKSPQKEKVSYILTNMAVSIGVSEMMPSLFLRLCYPTGILIPLLWGEIKSTTWNTYRNVSFYWLLLIFIALLLFLCTGGGWLHQIYWFFEM